MKLFFNFELFLIISTNKYLNFIFYTTILISSQIIAYGMQLYKINYFAKNMRFFLIISLSLHFLNVRCLKLHKRILLLCNFAEPMVTHREYYCIDCMELGLRVSPMKV